MDPQLPLFDVPAEKRPRRSGKVASTDAATTGATPLRMNVDGIRIDPTDELVARPIKLHSLKKAHYVFRYADTVGTALRINFPERWWIEAFAGPGRLYLADEERFLDGSPLDALRIRKPFSGYLFNDFSRENADALSHRIAGRHANAHVCNLDANGPAFLQTATKLIPRHALVVLYLDPEGLELHFSTIDTFAAAFDHLDLVINFPVRGIVRYLSAGHSKLAASVLDLRDTAGLVGKDGKWGDNVRSVMNERLNVLGFPHRTRREIRTGQTNSPLYELLVASRDPKAVELFEKAAAIEPDGQRQLGFQLGA